MNFFNPLGENRSYQEKLIERKAPEQQYVKEIIQEVLFLNLVFHKHVSVEHSLLQYLGCSDLFSTTK